MSPRTGRPPSDNPRTEECRFRLTPAESELLRQAAERAGVQMGAYARDAALAKAKRQR